MSSDNQTLILAGEAVPRRDLSAAQAQPAGTGSQLQRLTIIATRADDTTVFVQGEYAPSAPELSDSRQATRLVSAIALTPQGASRLLAPYVAANALVPVPARKATTGAAQYALMRDLPDAGQRARVIDTYA